MADSIITDKDLYHIMKANLSTALVGDVLDVMGLRKQFLPPDIAPLKDEMKIVGRAMPVLGADIFCDDRPDSFGSLGNKPFGLMMEALDNLKEDEIYIVTGHSFHYALWGGLMSTRAKHLNAGGAILNGYVRDSWEIDKLGFPVFSRGLYAQDQGVRGKVIDYRCQIEIEGTLIRPGDLIFGDCEGVLVIPRSVEKEAVERALAKASTENQVAIAIREGISASEAFATFGVL